MMYTRRSVVLWISSRGIVKLYSGRVFAGRMRRLGETGGREVRRADTVHRAAEAVADRRGTARQGGKTAVAEGARDRLHVQTAKDYVLVAVLYRSSQGK